MMELKSQRRTAGIEKVLDYLEKLTLLTGGENVICMTRHPEKFDL